MDYLYFDFAVGGSGRTAETYEMIKKKVIVWIGTAEVAEI